MDAGPLLSRQKVWYNHSMYSIKKSRFILLLIAAAVAGAAVFFGVSRALSGAGYGTATISASEYRQMKEMSERYEDLEQVYQRINKEYYQDVDPEKLIVGATKGMVNSLGDKYSSYMTKAEYDQWYSTVTGEYEGIGVTFVMEKKGQGSVVLVSEGSPAEKAGIKAGDVITKVNGKTFSDADKMSAEIRGDIGTEVKVTYVRDKKEKTVTIIRDKIVNKSVSSQVLAGDLGYIKIASFESSTYEDFRAALDSMEKKKVKGFIIDLRDNGGGLVETAVDTADDLLGKGNITYLQDRAGKKEYIDSDSRKTDLPYVILVNGNTASASEIVTAAVQDNEGGKIVGTKTFGKGIVQSTDTLEDGSALEITVLQYFSPDGHAIHKKGIKPDYVVKDDPKTDVDEQLEKAKGLLE